VETRALALSQVPMEIKGMQSSLNHARRIFSLINNGNCFSPHLYYGTVPDSVNNTTSLSSFKSALKTLLFRKSYF